MSAIDIESQSDLDLAAMDRRSLHNVDQAHLAALSRTVSTRTATKFEIGLSNENFQLETILRRQLRAGESSGIIGHAFGVSFRGLTFRGVDMATTSLFTLGGLFAMPFRIRESIRNMRAKSYLHVAKSTVREALRFAALLRQPRTASIRKNTNTSSL